MSRKLNLLEQALTPEEILAILAKENKASKRKAQRELRLMKEQYVNEILWFIDNCLSGYYYVWNNPVATHCRKELFRLSIEELQLKCEHLRFAKSIVREYADFRFTDDFDRYEYNHEDGI